MKTITVTAKNVEKAIKEGLEQLNATQEQVDIKILEQGGLFKKAKVEITLEEPETEKPVKKEVQKEAKEETAEEKPAKKKTTKKKGKKKSKAKIEKDRQEEREKR